MPLILRLLLCLVLVLNGTRPAAASHVMEMEPATAQLVQAPAAPEQPPCHDLPLHAAVNPGDADAMAAHTVTPETPADHGGNDCCGADACQCGCAQHHACAVLVAVAFVAPFLPQAASYGAMSTAHAPPTLANLIRPPIA